GQAIVETALILPIMLIIFCGIVDFGRILYASSHLNIVTQESVRLAAFGKSDYEVKQFVDSKVDLKDKDTIIVSLAPDDFTRKSG
ncbi:pilus assembly protein, partial [Listeria monocytogenes]|nr:pilus assembly protein [Listeria monocytogenes]